MILQGEEQVKKLKEHKVKIIIYKYLLKKFKHITLKSMILYNNIKKSMVGENENNKTCVNFVNWCVRYTFNCNSNVNNKHEL